MFKILFIRISLICPLVFPTLTACAIPMTQGVRVQTSNGALSEPFVPTLQTKTVYLQVKSHHPELRPKQIKALEKALEKGLEKKGYARINQPLEATFQLFVDLRYQGLQHPKQIAYLLKQGTRGKISDPLIDREIPEPQTSSKTLSCLIADLRLNQKTGEHWDTQKIATSTGNHGITELSTAKRLDWRQHQTRMVLLEDQERPRPQALQQAFVDTLLGIF